MCHTYETSQKGVVGELLKLLEWGSWEINASIAPLHILITHSSEYVEHACSIGVSISLCKLQRESAQQQWEGLWSLEILHSEISSSIWVLTVGPKLGWIVGDGDTKEKNFLTLIKVERKSSFRTILIGVKTIAIVERNWLNSKDSKDSWGFIAIGQKGGGGLVDEKFLRRGIKMRTIVANRRKRILAEHGPETSDIKHGKWEIWSDNKSEGFPLN